MTIESENLTVFSRIISREIPANIVAETQDLIAFHDISPQAPIHVVIVPKTTEYRNVSELAKGDPGLLANLVVMAEDISRTLGNGEFRLVFNSGESAGQTVFHVHAHMLSGGLGEGGLNH